MKINERSLNEAMYTKNLKAIFVKDRVANIVVIDNGA